MYVIGGSRDRNAVLEEVEEAVSFKVTGVGRGPRMGQGWAGPLEMFLPPPHSRASASRLILSGMVPPRQQLVLPMELLPTPMAAARLSWPLLGGPIPAML